MSFKFLIVLDRDEINQKTLDSITDPEVKERIMLLPVREIENLYLSPDLIIGFLNKQFPDQKSKAEWNEIINNAIEQVISKGLVDRAIRKSFLDKIPFNFKINHKNEMMSLNCENIEWLNKFYSYFQDKYWIESFKKDEYDRLFKEQESHYQNIDKQEKWKKFEGKEVRTLFFQKLKEAFNLMRSSEGISLSAINKKSKEKPISSFNA